MPLSDADPAPLSKELPMTTPKTLNGLQALPAIAAPLVVFRHCAKEIGGAYAFAHGQVGVGLPSSTVKRASD